jgi:mannosyltransferase
MVPLYFSLLYGWTRLFGVSLFASRLMSVFLGMLVLGALYGVGNAALGKRAGAFAACAGAVSLLQVYYSQEVRMYSLTLLLALLSVWAHLRATRKPGVGPLALSFAVNALLMCTHLFAFLIIGVQFLHLLIMRWKDWRGIGIWLAPHVALAVATAVWVSTIDFAELAKVSSYIWKPGLRDFVMAFVMFAGGRATNENPAEHLPSGVSLDLPLAVFMYALAAFGCWCAMRGSNREERGAVFILLAWVLVPATTLFLMAHLWRPCFTYRYVVHTTLPVYLLAGFGWSQLRLPKLRWLSAVVVAVCLLHQATAVAAGPFRVNWTAIGEHLGANAAPTDDIILFQSISRYALDYNHPLTDHRVRVAEVWSELRDEAIASHKRGETVWVVLVRWFDPEKFEAGLRREGIVWQSQDFASWPKARVYRIPAGEQ